MNGIITLLDLENKEFGMSLKKETLRNLNDQDLTISKGAIGPTGTILITEWWLMFAPTKCVAGSKLAQSVNYCPTEITVAVNCSMDSGCKTTGGC